MTCAVDNRHGETYYGKLEIEAHDSMKSMPTCESASLGAHHSMLIVVQQLYLLSFLPLIAVHCLSPLSL